MKVTLPTILNSATTDGKTTITGRVRWVLSRAYNVDVRSQYFMLPYARMGITGQCDYLAMTLPMTMGPRRFTLRRGRTAYANALRTPIS